MRAVASATARSGHAVPIEPEWRCSTGPDTVGSGDGGATTDRPIITVRTVRALALSARPGAIVMAEQAVDEHAALFRRHDERLAALATLARDLTRVGQAEPDLAPFLAQVEAYIGLLRRPMAA